MVTKSASPFLANEVLRPPLPVKSKSYCNLTACHLVVVIVTYVTESSSLPFISSYCVAHPSPELHALSQTCARRRRRQTRRHPLLSSHRQHLQYSIVAASVNRETRHILPFNLAPLRAAMPQGLFVYANFLSLSTRPLNWKTAAAARKRSGGRRRGLS